MTPEQKERLPQYAKEHIQDLENKIRHLTECLKQEEKEPTNVWRWVFDPKDSRNTYLPNDTYFFGESEKGVFRVRWDEEDHCLIVSGDGMISVEPRSGNLIYCRNIKQ